MARAAGEPGVEKHLGATPRVTFPACSIDQVRELSRLFGESPAAIVRTSALVLAELFRDGLGGTGVLGLGGGPGALPSS